ncbi:hypothetical protein C8Q72DRAFT_379512 [Fomitopsis betulina]|nr:hypothetical protein C8Q72DRAFT_379512 [Fomitopsis betulina]
MRYSTTTTVLIVAAATAAPSLAAPTPQAGGSYDLVQREVNDPNLWERTLAALGLSARAETGGKELGSDSPPHPPSGPGHRLFTRRTETDLQARVDEAVTELVSRAFGRKSPHPEPFWGPHHIGHSTSGHSTSDHSGHSGAGDHSGGGGGDHGDSSGGQTRRSDDGVVELIARKDGRKSTAPEQYYPSHHSGHSGDHSSSHTRSDDGELLARFDDEDVFARFDDDGLVARNTHTGKPPKSDTTFPTEQAPHGSRVRSRLRSYDEELLARFDDELVARGSRPSGYKPIPQTDRMKQDAYMFRNPWHGGRYRSRSDDEDLLARAFEDEEELMARFDDGELLARFDGDELLVRYDDEDLLARFDAGLQVDELD